MITSTAGIIGGVKVIPAEVEEILNVLDKGGANTRADTMFTFFWDDQQGDDLDMWISYNNSNEMEDKVGYSSGGGGNINGVNYRSFNTKLHTGLDFDAWAGGNNSKGKSVENIGIISSNQAPDGIYGVYLDNYKNYTGRDTAFNFVTLYKEEDEEEFQRVLWMRGTLNKDTSRGAGDITKMLHVMDLRKTGRTFSIERLTTQLEKVFEYQFGERV